MNYLIYGAEEGKIRKECEKIIKEHSNANDLMNTVTYNAMQTSMEEVLADATTIPFFSDKKIILLQNVNFLSGNKESDFDSSLLEKYLEHPLASTVLIMIGHFEKCDQRKKIVKTVNRTCRVIQCNPFDQQGKRTYILNAVKEQRMKFTGNALEMLIELLPNDSQVIDQELAKCSLYPDELNEEIIQLLVTRVIDDDVFKLVNAILNKNLKKAFKIWQDLCILNKEAVYLIAVLASQFRFHFQVKTLLMQGYSQNQIVDELKAHPYRVKLVAQAVSFIQASQLMKLLELLADCDQNIKNGLIDKKLGFELFLIKSKGVLE